MIVAAGLMFGQSAAAGSAPHGPGEIDRAIDAAVEYLASMIDPAGRCTGELPAAHPRFAAKTALCAYAMFSAEPRLPPPAALRALDWLSDAKLNGTCAVAMRMLAAAASDEQFASLIAEDFHRLLEAPGPDGACPAALNLHGNTAPTDNCSTAAVANAIGRCESDALEAPSSYWRLALDHWLASQRDDGGWAYRIQPEVMLDKTYGSMTAAALVSLHLCSSRLGRLDNGGEASLDRAIDRALMWLEANFSIDENPRLGVNGYYEWLRQLSRLGTATGRKHLGGHDWRAEGVAKLLAEQNCDGSWGNGEAVGATANALLFLLSARRPVAINKLSYPGRWNSHRFDCANLAGWLGDAFGRELSWQVVDIDRPVSDLADAPILYISGTGPIGLADEQIRTLRTFVHRGGLIVSEAAEKDTDFTMSMMPMYRRILPNRQLNLLDADHPVYSAGFSPSQIGRLWGVTNGIRLLGLHIPYGISRSLGAGAEELHTPAFELMANVYLYATGRGQLRHWTDSTWPEAPAAGFTPRRVVRLARLKHNGNYDPEPLAFERLGRILAARHAIALHVGGPMAMTDLHASDWPVAHVTGTGRLILSQRSRDALRKYVASGGMIIADAAGGSASFGQSLEQQLFALAEGGQRQKLSLQELRVGPEPLVSVTYRPTLAAALGEARHEPKLTGLWLDDRLAIVVSREDLTAALVGYPGYEIAGYSPACAAAIMTNLLWRTAVPFDGRPPRHDR